MRKKPKISIVINCHNGEQFLFKTLQSIAEQSFKDFEVIFWDNRSTDRSKDIYKSFKDKRFKYFYVAKKTSLYEGRNLAIKKTKGKYISFVDTDDFWSPKKLKIQYECFKRENIDIVYSNLWILKEQNGKKKLYINSYNKKKAIQTSILENSSVTLLTSLIRKSVFSYNLKPFNKNYNHIGDLDFFFKLSQKFKFKYLDKPLAYYRLHDTNLSKVKRANEVKELRLWLKKNENKISGSNINLFKERINRVEFFELKSKNAFLKCLKMILFTKEFNTKFTDLLVLFLPHFILKKIMWWY